MPNRSKLELKIALLKLFQYGEVLHSRSIYLLMTNHSVGKILLLDLLKRHLISMRISKSSKFYSITEKGRVVLDYATRTLQELM